MTFEANQDYTWGPQPKVQTIVYRIIGDPTAAVQAMENEEIDIIQPQATADILTQLEALADRGVEVDHGRRRHLRARRPGRRTTAARSIPATYGGDAATALAVRQAFLKTIPRQEIVDRLIIPLNPDAELRNSFTDGARRADLRRDRRRRTARPSTPRSTSRAPRRCSRRPASTTPIDVRFLFADNNPRRANEYELIRDSAAAGRLQRHRRQQPDLGPGPADTNIAVRRLAVRLAVDRRRRGRHRGELRHRRPEQLRRVLQPRCRRPVRRAQGQHRCRRAAGAPARDRAAAVGRRLRCHDLPAPGDHGLQQHLRQRACRRIPLSPTVFWNFWEWEAA